MGPTGTGKSSLIQHLTGAEAIAIGHGVESATSDIGQYNYFHENGRCVTFVDSPGFDDSREGVTDTDSLRKIAVFLEAQFNQNKILSGIIYLHRITDPRMGGVSVRNLKMFRKLCGDAALKNVVVVTTRWDDVQDKDKGAMEQREKELMATPGKFFEPLMTAGGRSLRHDNTAASARRIMEAFFENHPIPLQIQLEMSDGKTLEETAAGSELAAELKKLMDKHSSEIKNLEEEIAEAIAAKDEALKKELEAERMKMQKQMKNWQNQRKELADGLAAAGEDAK
ncbi:P-loop containing nucleoside triphosphate hydrolase protein [Mycena galopus ATCC 62051]|nr:P-loop containing nucleoside triphosphate hydrolase protein [Mycena galopus ATCC 62051]